MYDKTLNFLGSRRFAIFLLLLTVVIIIIPNLLPKVGFMAPEDVEILRREKPLLHTIATYFQVGSVVRSPLFLILPVFIFSSITICTIKRIKRETAKKITLSVKPKPTHEIDCSSDATAIAKILRKLGWRVEPPGESEADTIRGVRGERGFWGSVLFHAGMNVVLLGITLSLMTRYNGIMLLTDGYGMKAGDAFLNEMPVDFPVSEAMLKGFKATYVDNFPVDYRMNMILEADNRVIEREVGVNRPLKWSGYQFVPVRYGYSPRFLIKEGNEKILDAYVNLIVMGEQQSDHFEVPAAGIIVTAELFPDYYKEGLRPKSRSRELKNPVLYLQVTKDNETVGKGFVPLDKEISFAGYSILCSDIKMWVMFNVSRDSGVPVITVGFILILAGLIIRFIWGEKVVVVRLSDQKAKIGGWSRYFPALFEEELRKLTDRMRDSV